MKKLSLILIMLLSMSSVAFSAKPKTVSPEAQKYWEQANAELEDPDAYLVALKRAAELGHPEAMCDMGSIYAYGEYRMYDSDEQREKDFEKGIELLRKSADAGVARAYTVLGELYMGRYFGDQDKTMAETCLRQAVEMGDEEAQGMLYYYGFEIPRPEDMLATQIVGLSDEVLEEEVLETVQATELVIVRDEDVKTEMLSQDDLIARQRDQYTIVVIEPERPQQSTDKIYSTADQMPVFPGGEKALLEWIHSHIQYPAVAKDNNEQGRVVVQFVVTSTGSIGEVRVVRSKTPELDREAIRLVKALPAFTPAMQDGKAVNCWYTVPINFKLQD